MEIGQFLDATESERLLDKGVFFEVHRPFFLGGFLKKKKKIKFTIKEFYLGTLDYIDSQAEKIEYDTENIETDPLNSVRHNSKNNRKYCLKIVAYAILNSRFKIWMFSGVLAAFLKSVMKPSDLFKLAIICVQLSNYRDFMSAIRLMQNVRTTAPKTIAPERVADLTAFTASEGK